MIRFLDFYCPVVCRVKNFDTIFAEYFFNRFCKYFLCAVFYTTQQFPVCGFRQAFVKILAAGFRLCFNGGLYNRAAGAAGNIFAIEFFKIFLGVKVCQKQTDSFSGLDIFSILA